MDNLATVRDLGFGSYLALPPDCGRFVGISQVYPHVEDQGPISKQLGGQLHIGTCGRRIVMGRAASTIYGKTLSPHILLKLSYVPELGTAAFYWMNIRMTKGHYPSSTTRNSSQINIKLSMTVHDLVYAHTPAGTDFY